MRTYLSLVIVCILASGCPPDPGRSLDLDPPRLLGTSLPGAGMISPTDPIDIYFSEPLDPQTVTADSVMVVPHEPGAGCTTSLSCGAGRCHADRCQQDRVDTAWISDAVHPPLSAHRRGLLAPLSVVLLGTEVRLQPLSPMENHRLHTLLVGPTLTDRVGNPVELALGDRLVLLQRFATAGADSGRPTVWLRSPAPRSADLPVNLARVVVRFSRPVLGVDQHTLGLELGPGQPVATQVKLQSTLCRGVDRDSCYELRLLELLPPRAMVRLHVGPSIRDAAGREVLPLPDQVLATGDQVDLTPPPVDALRLQQSDGCVVVRLRTEDPTDLWMDGSWGVEAEGSVGATQHEVAMPVSPLSGTAAVTVQDLAGNQSSVQLAVPAGPAPRVAITEVLANPVGAEPAQELVELRNLSSVPVDLDAWSLDDGDDGVGVNLLPQATLLPGQRAVVVGKGYKALTDLDPAPAPTALLVRLPKLLGASGLSNAGESIVLRDPSGRLISSYGNQLGSVAGKSFEGHSVQRRVVGGCDVRASWGVSQGSATPGS